MVMNFSQVGVSVSLGGALDATPIDSPAPLHWRTFALSASDPDFIANGGQYTKDQVIGWELKVDDLRGGYAQVGDFARGGPNAIGFSPYDGDYRSYASSTLDHRYRRHLLLPTLATSYLPTGFSAASITAKASFWAEMGNGTFDDLKILWNDGISTFKLEESSASDATLARTQLLTGLGADIAAPTCCHSIRQGGATAVHRILVGQQGAAPFIFVVNSSSPANAMHANLSTCWGMIESPINATTPGTATNLFYANSGIWSLPITSADTAAPTQILSNIPNGGFVVGAEKLAKGNYDLRAFWAFPLIDKTTSVLTDNTPVKLVSTNEEGADLIDVPMTSNGLGWCYSALIWRRQLAWRDAGHVIVYDGETRKDLRILNGRAADSDHKYEVHGLGVYNDQLFALIAKIDITTGEASGGVGDSTLWLEMYIPEMDAWMPVTGTLTITGYTYTAGRQRNPRVLSARLHSTASRLCIVGISGFAHINMASRTFNRLFVSDGHDNPFNLYRQTGSVQNAAQEYKSTGTVTLPYFELPQLEGRWKRADQVVFLGDVDAGGTGAEVDISINGGAAIPFLAGVTSGPQVAQTTETGDDGLWQQLQIAIALTRGSTTTKTPNGLPILIRGRAYLTDPVGDGDGLPGGL